MTQDEIINMAIQAGILERKNLLHKVGEENLKAFAFLVEERCCSIIRDSIPRSGHDTKEYIFAFKVIDNIKRGI